MMVLDDFAAVSHSRTQDALRAAIERLAGELEFERYGIQYVTGRLDGGYDWRAVENRPDGYRETALTSGIGGFCPVMQHVKLSSMPLFWDREFYLKANNPANWEEQAPWGYGTGFSVAAHLGEDKHVVVGLEREKALCDTAEQLARKMAAFQLFATYVIDPCVAVLGDEAGARLECPLTKRELEVLQWTLDGKTAWEVGEILGITERTAALHVNHASQKLGSVNKHQAALKALRLGWIR